MRKISFLLIIVLGLFIISSPIIVKAETTESTAVEKLDYFNEVIAPSLIATSTAVATLFIGFGGMIRSIKKSSRRFDDAYGFVEVGVDQLKKVADVEKEIANLNKELKNFAETHAKTDKQIDNIKEILKLLA